MELLIELIDVLIRCDKEPNSVILPKGSKVRKLYNAVTSNKARSDSELAAIIYKCSGKEKKYLMLKRKLTKILSELILNTNTSSENGHQYNKVKFQGKRDLILAEKLLQQNVYHNAERIVVKVKAHSEQFHITEMRIECHKHLRTISALKGHPKKADENNKLINQLQDLHRFEQEAHGLYEVLVSKVKYFIGKYQEIADEAAGYSAQIEFWQKQTGSPVLTIYQCRIDFIQHYHRNDLSKWRNTLNRFDDLLMLYPSLKTDALVMSAMMEHAKYERSVGYLKGALDYTHSALCKADYESFNKFEVQALHFDLKIKEKEYVEAGRILKEVRSAKQFTLLQAPVKASWILREGYIYFLFMSFNQTTLAEKYCYQFHTKFSVSNFVECCKAIYGDKKGYNLMLMVLKQLLMKLKYPNDPEGAGNNLLVYYQRYMKDSCEIRSRAFMKSFAAAARFNFTQASGTDRNNKRTKILLPQAYDAPELIPYMHLYEYLHMN